MATHVNFNKIANYELIIMWKKDFHVLEKSFVKNYQKQSILQETMF